MPTSIFNSNPNNRDPIGATTTQPARPTTRSGAGTPQARADALADWRGTVWENVIGNTPSYVQRGLNELTEEGFRIQGENESRFADASDRLTGAVDGLGRTFTEDRFNSIFAAEAERGLADHEQNLDLIGESLGVRGVGGGVAADLAVQAHSQFQSALAGAKGNLRVAQINSDAQDAMRNINAEFQLGNFNSRGADESGLYAIEQFIQGHLGLGALRAQQDSIFNADKNAKRAANMSLAGSVIGAGLGAIGGL